MATPTAAQRAQVVELYVAYFNRAPEANGLDFWAQKFADLTELEGGNADAALKTVANGMWDAAEGEVGYDEATDTSAFLDMVYQNVLGRGADEEGKAFWTLAIDEGRVSLGEFILEFIGGITEANDPAGYERFNARNEVAEVWSQEEFSADLTDAEARTQGTAVIAGIDTAAEAQAKIADLIGSLPGNSFLLTTGQDNLVGTSGNDTFKAYIFDNQNTLQSGDMIDGAGGNNNKLIADIGSSSNFAITPHTVRVQTIELRAQSKAHDSGDNNTIFNQGGQTVDASADARIDAERSINVKEWINNNSRADLVIEDIRLDSINSNRESGVAAVTQITKDVTLTMRNTDAGAVDFRVYFEANSLKAAPTIREGAQLNIELMDTRSAVSTDPAINSKPLLENPFNGFTFKLDGNTITVQSEAIGAAVTYAELLIAVQNAVAAIPALRDFTVAISGKFTATDTLTGIQAQGDVITLTNNGAGVVEAGSYLTPTGEVPGSSGLHLEQDVAAPETIDALVTSKIILDNVGRGEVSDAYAPGSAAGDFVVGSMSTRGGVERFEVEVQRGSWINSLSSTNNTLQEVQLVNGLSPEGQNTTEPGYVHIGASLRGNSQYNNLVGWQHATNALATNGLTDVRLLDASTFEGDVKIGAQITRAVFDKYLNAIDKDTGLPNADDVNFDYVLGKGDNSLNLRLDKFVTGDADFNLTINTGTGTGTNIVNVRITDMPVQDPVTGVWTIDNASNGNWLTNQANLNNIAIVTNDGDNTVFTHGRGNYAITTGKGNDTVYVDNSGDKAVFILKAAATSFADRAIRVTEAQGVLPLQNDILSDAPVTYVGAYTKVLINFRDLTAEKEISFNGANGQFTDLQVNQAIKEAINSDPVLSKLLVAKDGPNRALIIESLIDGETEITDLTIGFATDAPTGNTLPVLDSLLGTSTATLVGAYAPEFALVAEAGAAVVIGTVTAEAPVDGVEAVETVTLVPLEVAALTAGAIINVSYNGAAPVPVTLTGNGLADFVVDLNAAGITGASFAAANGNQIVVTADDAGELGAPVALTLGTDAFGTVEETTPGTNDSPDVQTLALSGAEIAGLVDGATVFFVYDGAQYEAVLSGNGLAALTAAVNGAFASAVPTPVLATAALDGTTGITITAAPGAVVTGPTAFAVTADYVEADGSDSVAHSDNVITITGGDDVVVLGTNDTEGLVGDTAATVGSNDTVAFAANAADVNLTIVDFTTGNVAGFDTLDFTAFLGGAASGFIDTGFVLAGTANAAITLVNFSALTTLSAGTTFESLSAAQFQTAVNAGTEAAATANAKNVFLVQDGTDNVFKVFTTESAGTSTDFTTVKLVGTVDMADTDVNSLTFVNFA